ncbi:MAG: SET domain-containing protein [Anaerolineales bacterium]|nr:SET domain-containing protein [Anaerolineales bacterium]
MPFSYFVFPAEVHSNSRDFEIRRAVHNARPMRGVFARRPVAQAECALFIGTYPGRRIRMEEWRRKVKAYADRHAVSLEAAKWTLNRMTFSLERMEPGFLLDPSDENGELLPEFTNHLAGLVNEPPPGCAANAVFAYNRVRARFEVWLQNAVRAGEEIYAYYGSRYRRDYPVGEVAEDSPFHVIPADSKLIPYPGRALVPAERV